MLFVSFLSVWGLLFITRIAEKTNKNNTLQGGFNLFVLFVFFLLIWGFISHQEDRKDTKTAVFNGSKRGLASALWWLWLR